VRIVAGLGATHEMASHGVVRHKADKNGNKTRNGVKSLETHYVLGCAGVCERVSVHANNGTAAAASAVTV
jgi:hypothetical protein